MTTVDFGWALTGYLFVSLVLLFASSFTTLGWIMIIHGLILMPIFFIVLVLRLATILVSPGNSYGWSQGKGCYSNVQIVTGRAPATGPGTIPAWKIGSER
ncbi:hypothetical protein [Cyanobium gracile]|uniref:Uncharacterized protein n=1 Tax=Cyanobium gracile (strain ATCC 27147 / PCC 6307) TaxID=292564 RepID=K9P7U6_CYAGP|nr:hypothetical protein [Cyanobium gracile]AFY29467.1 hypothetical protein Cyagr_2360 [Cyanobium gracile PCC 6307]